MSAVISAPSTPVMRADSVAVAGTTVPVALTATERLTRSRDRLRQAMRDSSAQQGRASVQHAGGPSMAWLESLKAVPGATLLIEAVRSWWARHPLRIPAMVAADAAKAAVQPMAQRHPLGVVLGALLLGGLFAWSRPWRWILTPALFAGLLPQLFSKAMAQVPVQSWLAVLTSLTQEQRRPTQTSARSPKNA